MPAVADYFRTALWKVLCSQPLQRFRPLVGLEFGHFKGHYASGEEALNSVVVSGRSTYNHEELVSYGIKAFSTVHNFDWPVLFYLQKLLKEGKLRTVTDFGGHIGVKFYAFQEFLDYPSDFTWQVVDVSVMVKEGRLRVPPGVDSLQFFERLEDTSGCDVLICSGVLQYVDLTVEQIVERLPSRPRLILFNKVAVSNIASFYTVENYIKCLAYRVFGPSTTVVDRRLAGAIRAFGSGSGGRETGAFVAIATSVEDVQGRTIRAREDG